jgi:hypothetical protein
MKYRYNGPAAIKVKAHIVADEITQLIESNNGAIIPETVVRAARPKRSRLHKCFEWDDKKAAKLYRVEQAKHILRAVIVEYETDDENCPTVEVRAFPNIETDGGNYYTTMARVAEDEEMSEQLENQIYRDLCFMRKKHKNIKRFSQVWQAVDAL